MCKITFPFIIALLLVLAVLATPAQEKKSERKKLFNGKDFTGWKIFLDPRKKADPKKIWQVKNGIIICSGKVNGYIRTKKQFGDYVLKLQWRWGKKKYAKRRNSGVFVHVVGPDKIWPKAVEAQLMADHAGDFWLVGGFDLKVDKKRRDPKIARHYLRMKDNVERPVGQWNQYEITCKGKTIKLVINGKLVNMGTNAELTRGNILLQSEGAEIHFKDIELRHLK